MARIEVLEERFFPSQTSYVLENHKYFPGAPPEAVAFRDTLQESWLKTCVRSSKEEPAVCMALGEKDGQTGYFV